MADIGMLRAAIAPVARLWRRPPTVTIVEAPGDGEQAARAHYREGLDCMRGGKPQAALAAFDRALALLPDFADAVMARAEALDGQGRSDEARSEYERARRFWSERPSGAADRRYLFRQRGYFAFEVEAYDRVRTNLRGKLLPQLAHGNALLVRGRPAEALDSYECALKIKPDLVEAQALKGEALLALGRFEEAIKLFDGVLAADAKNAESLNSRGIARLAMGQVAEANEDWRHQLELLPATNPAARGCVAMRQGNHGAAFHEFGLAAAKDPANPYWSLYRFAAARLAGLADQPADLSGDDRWPAVLTAFQAGRATEDAVMSQATTACRRAEALFQMGVMAAAANPAVARRHWRDVVDCGLPQLIEYAAASNELARRGS